MAKGRRDIKKVMRSLRRGVGSYQTKKNMRKLGEMAIAAIVKRTREGFGVSRTGGRKRRLLPLSDSYIERRKRSNLHDETTPTKSNLTFTGRMLDSMRIKEVTNTSVKWGPSNQRRKGGVTNAQIGEYVAKAGRPFNFLSKEDIASIVKTADKALQRLLTRL